MSNLKTNAIRKILGKTPLSGHVLKFGKYKGSDISDVPESYLKWMINEGLEAENCEIELERRERVDKKEISKWK